MVFILDIGEVTCFRPALSLRITRKTGQNKINIYVKIPDGKETQESEQDI